MTANVATAAIRVQHADLRFLALLLFADLGLGLTFASTQSITLAACRLLWLWVAHDVCFANHQTCLQERVSASLALLAAGSGLQQPCDSLTASSTPSNAAHILVFGGSIHRFLIEDVCMLWGRNVTEWGKAHSPASLGALHRQSATVVGHFGIPDGLRFKS